MRLCWFSFASFFFGLYQGRRSHHILLQYRYTYEALMEYDVQLQKKGIEYICDVFEIYPWGHMFYATFKRRRMQGVQPPFKGIQQNMHELLDLLRKWFPELVNGQGFHNITYAHDPLRLTYAHGTFECTHVYKFYGWVHSERACVCRLLWAWMDKQEGPDFSWIHLLGSSCTWAKYVQIMQYANASCTRCTICKVQVQIFFCIIHSVLYDLPYHSWVWEEV